MDSAELRALMVKVAKEELGENDEIREEKVKQFKNWLLQNPDVRNYNGDDATALLYLRKGKFSIQKAQEIFLRAQTFRNSYHMFMGDTNILDPKVNIFTKNGYHYVSPLTDSTGAHIIIIDMGKVNPSDCEYEDYVRAQVATAQALMYKEVPQVLGVTYVIDMKQISVAHITHMPIAHMLDYLKAVQQTIPLRFKGFHFINMPGPLKWFFDLIKSNATAKMKNRFMAHNSLEELHEHVSPDILPKEYGGKIPKQEMIDLWYEELMKARDTTKYWNSFRLVQPLNGRLENSLAELPGTFRKLEVD